MAFSYLCKSSEFFQSLQIMFLKQLFVQASGKVCKPLGESLQSSDILDYLKQQLETLVCLRSNFGNLPIFNHIATDYPSISDLQFSPRCYTEAAVSFNGSQFSFFFSVLTRQTFFVFSLLDWN